MDGTSILNAVWYGSRAPAKLALASIVLPSTFDFVERHLTMGVWDWTETVHESVWIEIAGDQ